MAGGAVVILEGNKKISKVFKLLHFNPVYLLSLFTKRTIEIPDDFLNTLFISFFYHDRIAAQCM